MRTERQRLPSLIQLPFPLEVTLVRDLTQPVARVCNGRLAQAGSAGLRTPRAARTVFTALARLASAPAPSAMVGIREQIHTYAVAQVALRRTVTASLHALSANTTGLTASSAMAGVATQIDAFPVTNGSRRARAAAVLACLTRGTCNPALTAIERILPDVSTATVTRHSAPGTKAASASAVFSRSTTNVTFPAVGGVVQYVHAPVTAVHETGTTNAIPIATAFGRPAHVAAFAAVSRIEVQISAVAVRTQRHRVGAITDALIRKADVFPAVVAASPTIVVIGA